jgi:hypothetical protein
MVTGNTASQGGGIFNSNGTVTLNGGTVSNNVGGDRFGW